VHASRTDREDGSARDAIVLRRAHAPIVDTADDLCCSIYAEVAHSTVVGSSRGTKLLGRIRAGGVVTSKMRLAQDALHDPGASLMAFRKLRVGGLPNRKAANLKKR
jgi:hypothetical protein